MGVIIGRIKDSIKMAGLGDGYKSKALPRAEQSKALEKVAAEKGISMEEAALRAIELYSSRRKSTLLKSIKKIKTEDSKLLKGLAK